MKKNALELYSAPQGYQAMIATPGCSPSITSTSLAANFMSLVSFNQWNS